MSRVTLGRDDLPAEDRERSPFTGWMRRHWETTADLMLEAVDPYFTPQSAFVRLPARAGAARPGDVDGLEGFARTFLLAAFRLRGASGVGLDRLADRYAQGLAAGTNPASGEAWPEIRSRRQPLVEAASVALALWESRPWVWDQLAPDVQQRVAAWLGSVNGKECWPNNWLLFPVVVNAFLESVGAPHRPDTVERNLERVDALYRSDGWYTDGAGRNYDHYASWGFHFYTALWCRMDGGASDSARAATYRERLRRFLEDYRFLFGADGAPLHHGRSLIYRFAAVAALWAGALVDSTPLAPGETRRIASGALRYFLDRGALRDGILTVGWHGPCDGLAQAYSGSASPYWASKAFLGLVIPSSDPVWTAREEPLPVEQGDFVRSLPEPGFLAWGTAADGIVRVASHRSDHFPLGGSLAEAAPLYRKVGYSTHTSPELESSADLDSQVALVSPDGAVHGRKRFHTIAVADRFAASAHYPREWAERNEKWSRRIGRDLRLGPIRVESVSIANGSAEIRVVHVQAPASWRLRTGGFALGSDNGLETETGAGWAAVRRADGLTSLVVGVAGFGAAGVRDAEGTNAFGPESATPFLETAGSIGDERVFVALVVLAGAGFSVERALEEAPAVAIDGRCVVMRCGTGDRYFVQLGAQEPVALALDSLELTGPVRFARASADGSTFVLGADDR